MSPSLPCNWDELTNSGWEQWRRNEFESEGAHVRRKRFFVIHLYFCGSTSTIGRFGERFRDGQYSLVSFLFAVLLYSRCPMCPAICKSGERAPWFIYTPAVYVSGVHPVYLYISDTGCSTCTTGVGTLGHLEQLLPHNSLYLFVQFVQIRVFWGVGVG